MHEAFRDLHAHTRAALADLAGQWAAGELSASTFAEAMDATLLLAHTEAVVIGRTHAGDDTPEEEDDRRFAGAIVEGEHDFLQQFRLDLDAGRYTGEDGVRDGDAVAARAEMYADRITGTANDAWGLTLPEEIRLTWTLGAADGSTCTDCPELADASPYTTATIPTYPGKGETLCGRACRCSVDTEGGQRGFTTP